MKNSETNKNSHVIASDASGAAGLCYPMIPAPKCVDMDVLRLYDLQDGVGNSEAVERRETVV
jgi:hypothetical protein